MDKSDGIPRNAVKMLDMVIDMYDRPALAVKMIRDSYLEVGIEGTLRLYVGRF